MTINGDHEERIVGRQPEDLSAQVDGIQSTFTTLFQRSPGSTVVFHNSDKVLEAQVTEPSSKQISLGFVPALNDELFVVYFTDETVDGRVQGFPDDPTVIPPPAFPQGLQEILEDLDARIDDVESKVDQPPDSKDSVHVVTLADLGAVYDNVGGTALNGSFTGAPLVVDGVTILTGFRVLVMSQTGLDENGVYVVLTPGTGSDGAWERAPDFLTGAGTQVTEGARTYVSRGTQQGKAFVLTTADPITVGGASGSALTFIEVPTTLGLFVEVVRAFVVGVAATDAVYQKADGSVDKADSTSLVTMPAIGIVSAINSPSVGLCQVRVAGDLGGFSGLTGKKIMIVGTVPGSIVADDDVGNPAYPSRTPGSGSILQEVGQVKDATTLLVGTNRDFDEV